jgi:hypothetical protein
MNLYLKSIVNQLRNYSDVLDITSMIINKPWALVDEGFEVQKLIFKSNKELVLSKNGQVQFGKWDYFPEAKSLLIDRSADVILCNIAFIDKGVIILKLDGTENRFFMLANENIVPDLNAKNYLKQLRYQKLNIEEAVLSDGRILEIQREEGQHYTAQVGNTVSIDAEIIDDGKYQFAETNKYLEVEKGLILKILTETTYSNPDNQQIVIQQQDNLKIRNGDYVFMFGKPIENAVLNFSRSKNLIVRAGKVVRFESKNSLIKCISKVWKKTFDDYND